MIPRSHTAAGFAIAWVLAGCGGAGHQTTRSPQGAPRASVDAAARSEAPGTTSRVSVGTPIVTLPALGSLSYRCDSAGQRVAATLTNGPAPDTGATVTVESDHGVHLHTSTVSAGQTAIRSTPFGRYDSLTWRIILTTEPRSLIATIRLRFYVGLIHGQGKASLINCTLRSWNVSGQVIEHDRMWSNPSPWP